MTIPNEQSIEDAASQVDGAAGVEGGEKDGGGEEPKSVKQMLKMFKKHSDGTNVVKESIQTFSNPDGSDKKGDLVVQSVEDGVARMKELVDADRSKHEAKKKKPKKAAKWNFRSSPHEHFGKTLDDTFTAFVMWAKTKDDSADDSQEKMVSGYNVSKAFRRLEAYAEWMEDAADDLVEPALTAESCREALGALQMKTSVSDDGSFCWWIDLGAMDIPRIKSGIPVVDSFRAFVWYSHYVLYDETAQRNGLVFVEACNRVGFLEAMTMMPMKLSAKLDRLSIGVLPIRMKKFLIAETPTWMDMLMKFMSLFMSPKMKKRIVICKDWSTIEETLGKGCIPKGFGKLEGSLEADPVETKYFSG